MKISEELNNLRKKTGWTLSKISTKTGVPIRTIENWSDGSRTPPDYVAALVIEKAINEYEKEEERKMKEKKLFSVEIDRIEFDPRKHATVGSAFDEALSKDRNPEKVGLYETIEEARKKLAEIKVNTTRYSYKLASAKVAYITEATYELEDEEWEFIEGEDFWDLKFEEIEELSKIELILLWNIDYQVWYISICVGKNCSIHCTLIDKINCFSCKIV